MNDIFFNHSSIDRHLKLFCVLAISNNAALNMKAEKGMKAIQISKKEENYLCFQITLYRKS